MDSSASYTEPVLVSSVDWVRDLLTGPLAIMAAVVAIAWIGFALLQGRIPTRDGARVVVGCFILFGAPIIADAFVRMAGPVEPPPLPAKITFVSPPIVGRTQPTVYDPYAGASVPNH